MIASWLTHHEAFRDGEATGTLAPLRAEALERFRALGFPNTRLEAWKYTSTRALAAPDYTHGPTVDDAEIDARLAPHRLAFAAAELVFVDGRYVPSLSRGAELAGLTWRPLAEALEDDADAREAFGGLLAWQDDAFSALSTAFVQDGLYLSTERGAQVEGLVHVLSVTSATDEARVSHPRHLFRAAPNSFVSLVETHVGGTGTSLTNAAVETYVDQNAELHHAVLHVAPAGSHLVHSTEARLSRDARYRFHATWVGGAVTRSNVRVVHAEPGAQAWLDGVYVLGGEQHCDNHTVIDHVAPQCITRESYKGVLGGRAKGVFDGRIIVRQDAQHTDSTQSNRNILLTDTADANAKPTLEIYADDVKCAHGTTVGQLDKNQLDYLRTRGIPLDQAKRVLTEAFVADRVQTLVHDDLRLHVQALVDDTLHRVQEDA